MSLSLSLSLSLCRSVLLSLLVGYKCLLASIALNFLVIIDVDLLVVMFIQPCIYSLQKCVIKSFLTIYVNPVDHNIL